MSTTTVNIEANVVGSSKVLNDLLGFSRPIEGSPRAIQEVGIGEEEIDLQLISYWAPRDEDRLVPLNCLLPD